MPLSHPRTRSHLYLMLACPLFLPDRARANFPYAPSHSIGKRARIFNTRLIGPENRIAWLNGQLTPLVLQQNPELSSHFGIRCERLKKHDPDPWVTARSSHSKKWNDLSGLSEGGTVSHHQGRSFSGPVASTSSINTLTQWWPGTLSNASMPFDNWQHIKPSPNAEDRIKVLNHAVHHEPGKPESKLPLDAKRHLFLFYKEAVQNILKNSQARHAYIRISDVDDKPALKISDDGIGLPSDADHRNVLIHRLEKRTRMLEGSLRVRSSMEQGTPIRLLVKRSYLKLHSSLS